MILNRSHFLPVLSPEEIRRVEGRTMELEPISSIELMERAAQACAQRIRSILSVRELGKAQRCVVVAGMGNNGGDGLVIARALNDAGIQVRVVRVRHRSSGSPEHEVNWERVQALGITTTDLDGTIEGFQLAEDEFVVDALFGSGLTHPPTGWIRNLIASINTSGNAVVAIDLPSGMLGPEAGGAFEPEACMQARFTLTFEVPRLALLVPESGPRAGRWELIPIGLDRETLLEADREASWMDSAEVGQLLWPAPRFSHKGTLGHALIVAGSRGMYGAAMLANTGALRSGAGLVTAHLPAEFAPHLSAVLPDAMTSVDPAPDKISKLPELERFTAIGLGPGLGLYPESKALLLQALNEAKVPLVLDADALTLIASDPALMKEVPVGSVLTPHPKEMDRLLGTPAKDGYDRIQRCRELAQRMQCTIVLKGAFTCICVPDGELYFNSTGNAGMAKGGSGDVLTGLLTGLIAQGYSAECAAVIGVHLHGLAGDLCRNELGAEAMRPSDLVARIPQAWQRLWSASEQAVQ